MDKCHGAMDKLCTAYGQENCPRPAHTLTTAP